MAAALSGSGFRVKLFGFGVQALQRELGRGIDYIDLGPDPAWLDICGPQVAYGLVRRRIAKTVEMLAKQVDVFHSPYGTGYFSTLGIPLVITGWSYGTLLEMIAYGARSFSGSMRVVASFGHAAYYLEDRKGYSKAASCVFTTTAGMQAWTQTCRRAVYIPCPVDVPRNFHAIDPMIPGGRLRLLVGERDLARPRNHVREFLRACAVMPESAARRCDVVLVGAGSARMQGLIQKARSTGVTIRTVSYLERENFYSELAQADMVVQLRDILDQGGYLSLEAMALGKGLLVSHSRGFADYVSDGVNGMVVNPDEVPELSSMLTRLSERPEEVTRLGRASLDTVRSHHEYDVVARSLLRLYSDLVGQGNS
ncbi:MAG: glycosyltransferase family 4 protein [Thermoplasmata archaeon]|nr:glycosyltransferase family 4 protein [Thermoplasmata archaeon]